MPGFAHPGFAPYRRWLGSAAVPDLAALNAWGRAAALALPDGRPLRFLPATPGSALAFETAIAHAGEIGVRRGSRHDALNALAWLAFPRTKAALNARHVQEGMTATRNGRSRARDAATLLDESGLILACADARLVELLRDHAWRELFVRRRATVVRRMRALVVGHGLLAKLASPFRAVTAHTLVVPLAPEALPAGEAGETLIDEAAAAAIAAPSFAPAQLLPLPVAALPGWDTERLGDARFDDASVFRPPRATLARP